MDKIDIAGLKIDAISKQEFLNVLQSRMTVEQKTWATTPYSEFLHAALLDPKVLDVLNQADFAVPDGIGLFWAKRFLEIPLTAKSYWGKIFQALWQIKYSLAAIIFYPRWIKSALPEKISGADLIWDLAELAAKNNWSIYLLGGFNDTSAKAAKQLRNYCEKTHNLQLTTYNSSKNPDDPTIIQDIKNANPDLLFVAFGPIKQEQWIAKNLPNLPVKLAAGLGGTFDYIAGKQPQPPGFLRQAGLEWLWRLFTQPRRYKRIYNALFGLANSLVKYKIFNDLPLRPNVVIVILNTENKILVCKRRPGDIKQYFTRHFLKQLNTSNYWQLPQGGRDLKENLVEAARREAKEETGLENLQFTRISDKTNTYFWDSATRTFWGNRNYLYSGQKQNFVYFKLFGNDSEIKLENKELVNYKWVSIKDLAKTVHPERLAIAKIVQEDLKNLA